MTPNFVEELFLRIEERLNALEIEMHEIKTEISWLNRDVSNLSEFTSEMENIRRWTKLGRGFLLIVWGFLVTAVNVLIGRLLNGK